MFTRWIGAIAVTLGLAAGVSAGPIGQSALGIDKDVQILSHTFNVLNGGSFYAIVDGFDTQVFCVDNQNHVYVPDEYLADVVALSDWDSTDQSHVRKGNNTTWPALDAGYNGATALQRYQAAAWLVSQYSAFPSGTGTANGNDQALQTAIWYLLYQGTGGAPALNSTSKGYAESALDAVFANPTFGFYQWAIISGEANGGGRLLNSTKQTFLVQLDPSGDTPTPEPATYAFLGAGLIAMALFRKR